MHDNNIKVKVAKVFPNETECQAPLTSKLF